MSDVENVSPEAMKALMQRVEHAVANNVSLDADDMRLLLDAIHTLMSFQTELSSKNATLLKLKKLLGLVKSSENRTPRKPSSKKSNDPKKNNTPIAKPQTQQHEVQGFKKGDPCPACNKGTLKHKEPKSTTRVQAQVPFQTTIHILKRLACPLCGFVVSAPLPESVQHDGDEDQKYGFSARSMMAIHKHFSGTPYFHQQNLNLLFGCPITASTILDQCEQVANAANSAFHQLRKTAANAVLFYIDDTRHRILSSTTEERPKRNGKGTQQRSGITTSGLIAVLSCGKMIYLYETSLGHAGELLDDILRWRQPGLAPPIISCDALSANKPTVQAVILALCNAHGRQQFYDLEKLYPEVSELLDTYDNIWKHEHLSRKLSHTPEERLRYHKEHSLPLMQWIQQWCERYLASPDVEEHGALGKACRYFLNHYDGLTQFCHTAGAPIDNNKMEEGLKLPIQGPKSSHFYKTENGAGVSNILLSLIATAYRNDVNAFHYLNALQRFDAATELKPQSLLPWDISELDLFG